MSSINSFISRVLEFLKICVFPSISEKDFFCKLPSDLRSVQVKRHLATDRSRQLGR